MFKKTFKNTLELNRYIRLFFIRTDINADVNKIKKKKTMANSNRPTKYFMITIEWWKWYARAFLFIYLFIYSHFCFILNLLIHARDYEYFYFLLLFREFFRISTFCRFSYSGHNSLIAYTTLDRLNYVGTNSFAANK